MAEAGISARFALAALACALVAGCAHERLVTDSRHPEIEITASGVVTWRGKAVDADELPQKLRDAGFTRKDTINIRVPADIKDYRMSYYVMRRLVENGFSRPILVTEKRSYSETAKPSKNRRIAK